MKIKLKCDYIRVLGEPKELTRRRESSSSTLTGKPFDWSGSEGRGEGAGTNEVPNGANGLNEVGEEGPASGLEESRWSREILARLCRFLPPSPSLQGKNCVAISGGGG